MILGIQSFVNMPVIFLLGGRLDARAMPLIIKYPIVLDTEDKHIRGAF